jgi:HEAT repeat protein
MGEPMSIDTFLDELADTGRPLKTGRLTRLSGLDDDERGQLASYWVRLPVERRRAVLQQISDLAEDNPELDFDAVFSTALEDSDAAARRLAIEGLWEHEGRDVIQPFTRLLHGDADAGVRAAAAEALGRFVLLGEFGDIGPRDAQTVTDALRATIADRSESVEVRGRALEAVGACSQTWAKRLIQESYDSAEDHMVLSAVQAMGRSADTHWVSTLIDELQSTDARLRYEAASALGQIEDDAAVPYLAELLDDEDSEIQEAAIHALGEIGGDDAIVVLRRRADDPDERVASAVREALDEAEFGDDPLGLRP